MRVSVPTFDHTVPLVSVHGWLVVYQRIDGSVNFNRSWTEYRNGFGDTVNGSFWLGNEAIYQLTNAAGNASCRLRFELLTNASQMWYSVEYAQFHVDNESRSYAIHVAGYSGDAGDAINALPGTTSYQNGAYFSTYDHLPPNYSPVMLMCAASFGGGWWYNGCGRTYLTATYGTKSYYWGTLTAPPIPSAKNMLMATRMMIKCV